MTKEEIKRDKRLRKLYGRTLAEYNYMLKEQQGLCAGCLKPPVNVSLSLDHDHRYKYLKLIVQDGFPFTDRKFVAYTKCGLQVYDSCLGKGDTARAAKRDLRVQLKWASGRGLLCYFCNVGIQKFRDNPDNLERAAAYLRRHQESTEVK